MNRRRLAGLAVAVVVALLLVTWSRRDAAKTVATPSPSRSGAIAGHPHRGDAVTTVAAHEPPTEVAGVVRDAAGPVAGATIELSSHALGTRPVIERSARSDATGRFRFEPVDRESYTVIARADGHPPTVLTADLRSTAEAAWWRDARLELDGCAHTVEIHVASEVAAPVGDAAVAIAQRGAPRIPLGITGADGRLTACVTGGVWTMTVEAPGRAIAHREVDLVAATTETFVLGPELVLRGVLVDVESGELIADDELGECRVWAVPLITLASAQPVLVFGACLADAEYEVRGLSPGGYNVFATTSRHASDRAQPVQLAVGVENAYPIPLSSRSTLEGTVVDDTGRAVAGVTLHATGPSSSRSRNSTTSADGHFTLELVPHGELGFAVDGREVISPRTWSSTATGLQVVVAAGTQVRGKVVSHGEPTVAMVAFDDGHRRHEISTEADGSFLLDAGAGALVLTARSGARLSSPLRLDLEPGAVTDVVLELAEALTIEGRVRSKAGTPVARMWVRAACEGDLTLAGDARSAADGSFEIVLPHRSACSSIRVFTANGAGGRKIGDDQVDVPVAPDASRVSCVLTLAEVFELRVAVADADGTPVPGALVSIRSTGAGEVDSTTTDAGGEAHLSGLRRGWHSLDVVGPGGRHAARDVDVGAVVMVRLTFQAAATLVVGDRGDPSADAWHVLVTSASAMTLAAEATVAAGGEDPISVPPGDYLVLAQRAPQSFLVRSVHVPPGGEVELSLTATSLHAVEVALDELWGQPLSAPLTCRPGPAAMIAAASPVLARLAPVRLTTSSTLAMSVGGDVALWCAADPAVASDGIAMLTGAAATVTVVTPRPGRAIQYIVRKAADLLTVEHVLDGAPGLQRGDVVASIDGRATAGLTELGLGYALLGLPPGDHAVGIVRDGKPQVVELCVEGCAGL